MSTNIPQMPTLYQFPENNRGLIVDLFRSDPIHRGEWQAMDVSMSKMHATYELLDTTIWLPQIPATQGELAVMVGPDLPWAEEHLGERVSGVPFNPAPSHVRWPYAVRGNADHLPDGFKFDHTYPERFWPKGAGDPADHLYDTMRGIRYEYGDLGDVVEMLRRNPATRQAFLPVWFPEDTGAGAGKRVPCTLGYHFMVDSMGLLGCRYYIRSCDVYRHLLNDIYLAGRLTQWICQQVNLGNEDRINLHPGAVVMHISSLHAFVGDVKRIERKFLGE